MVRDEERSDEARADDARADDARADDSRPDDSRTDDATPVATRTLDASADLSEDDPHSAMRAESDASEAERRAKNSSEQHIDEPSEADQLLLRAAQAFDRGDYRQTRKLARIALEHEAVAEDASRLLAQLEPPRLTKVMLALTGVLLTLVTVFAYSR